VMLLLIAAVAAGTPVRHTGHDNAVVCLVQASGKISRLPMPLVESDIFLAGPHMVRIRPYRPRPRHRPGSGSVRCVRNSDTVHALRIPHDLQQIYKKDSAWLETATEEYEQKCLNKAC